MGSGLSKAKQYLYFGTNEQFDEKDPSREGYDKSQAYNYFLYKKKKYYDDKSSEEEAMQQVERVARKQRLLKSFKFHEEFDRKQNKNELRETNATSMQSLLEVKLHNWLIMSFFCARIITMHTSLNWFGQNLVYRTYFRFLAATFPFVVANFVFTPYFHVTNHDYFRVVQTQIAMHQQFDQQIDLYRDNDISKYETPNKVKSTIDFHVANHRLIQKSLLHDRQTAEDYIMIQEGVKLDQYDQFIKARQKVRKQTKGSLYSEEELSKIREQLNSKDKKTN